MKHKSFFVLPAMSGQDNDVHSVESLLSSDEDRFADEDRAGSFLDSPKRTKTKGVFKQSKNTEDDNFPLQWSALQWSILQFTAPLVYAIVKQEYILAVSIVCVMCAGIIVHRPIRPQHADIVDLTDHIFIGCWLVANVYIHFTIKDVRIQIGGVVFAFLVLFFGVLRRSWPFQSPERVKLHIAMHLCGSAGTMLILFGSTKVSYESA